ncbi:amidohydrolase family protein [Flavobacterium sp. F-380]|uniref:Amidohydrolase family protein n=1 Tax=Flavobacterium kayseriense TaxID=2764714 RepID=A0ABR7J977_9FLAO|nr:amidohydrolase family protein [Flavobacterium kayseriense]MBC5842012.1 amidohydrolase family protein [Flavobacterium kayseriense]MBC5848541.1 amidohydrolase family protein [Flavobacterium kayseriense]
MKKTLFLVTILFSTISFAQDTYLHCGKIIDTKTGKVLSNKTIIVSNNMIKAVQDGFINPTNALDKAIDLKTKTVMPGWIDMHVHVEEETSPTHYGDEFTLNDADIAFNSIGYAKTTLMAGFTTVRDLGGTGINVSLRNAINKGKVVGPRILTAEKALASTGGHADPTNGYRKDLMGNPGPNEGVVNGVDDAKQAVRQRYKNGADWIKITATGGVLSVAKSGTNAQFTQEEMDAIIATAKDYGLQVAAHAHGDDGMQRAIKAGVKTIEHGTEMSDATMDLMIKYNAYYIPTLSAGSFVAEKALIPNYYPAIVVPKALAIGPRIKATFAKAYKKGVPIGFGTDAAVFPHGENAKEFIYMQEAGMPAMKTIQAATIVNATILEMEKKIGALEVGYLADIVATNDDPTKDITTVTNVVFVMKDGIVYKQL